MIKNDQQYILMAKAWFYRLKHNLDTTSIDNELYKYESKINSKLIDWEASNINEIKFRKDGK